MDASPGQVEYQAFTGRDQVDNSILEEAAQLFSDNYGIWSKDAPVKVGKFARPGARIKSTSSRLKAQHVPEGVAFTYIRAVSNDKIVGNVFASYWEVGGRTVCWITQLVVDKEWRGQHIATKLLSMLWEPQIRAYGILSSHAHACMAAVNALACGMGGVNLDLIRHHAAAIMEASPVKYVREANLHGALFEETQDGSISSADTNFFVDHDEPLQALQLVLDRDISWPFGELTEGHEFLMIVGQPSLGLDERNSSDF